MDARRTILNPCLLEEKKKKKSNIVSNRMAKYLRKIWDGINNFAPFSFHWRARERAKAFCWLCRFFVCAATLFGPLVRNLYAHSLFLSDVVIDKSCISLTGIRFICSWQRDGNRCDAVDTNGFCFWSLFARYANTHTSTQLIINRPLCIYNHLEILNPLLQVLDEAGKRFQGWIRFQYPDVRYFQIGYCHGNGFYNAR